MPFSHLSEKYRYLSYKIYLVLIEDISVVVPWALRRCRANHVPKIIKISLHCGVDVQAKIKCL
jgi:hypothetical protein